ncbi:MAG TPA: hypothetical protein VFA43_16960 [Gemmatimonadaceae bacterium]|nr:hypothetical protein [Gemmatimonadaceae bacterium]
MIFSCPRLLAQRSDDQYTLAKLVKAGHDLVWDFYTLDESSRLLLGGGNTIVDIDSLKVTSTIADSIMAGGFQVSQRLQRGVTRHGAIFDLKSGAVIAHLRIRGDASVYDSSTDRVYLLADTIAVVDLAAGVVAGTIVVPGAAESGVADGAGHLYLNLGSKDSIAVIDTRTLRRIDGWSLAPCTSPQGLAIDRAHRRLFVACHHLFAAVSADDGHIVATLPLPGQADENAFDPGTGLIFMPNGYSSTLGNAGVTVIHEDSPDRYTVRTTLVNPLLHGARIVVDQRTHRLFMAHKDANGDFWWLVLVPAAGAQAATTGAP